MASLPTKIKPIDSITAKASTHQHPKDQRRPYMKLCTSSASRQKTTLFDTLGNFQPEETNQQKSYVAILASKAANNNKVSPLEQK